MSYVRFLELSVATCFEVPRLLEFIFSHSECK